ncbi:MAG: O-antigen ligase family protein [Lachnospiraceae bacterium]|nr:O-antigen ligase family protein [Lachnospiraceae bacterium]
MSNKYSKKRSKHKTAPGFNYLLLPVLLIVSVVPLIVHSYIFNTWLAGYDYYSDDEVSVDFFLAWKMWTFVALSAVIACVLVYKVIKEKRQIRFSVIYLPLAGYAVLAILSSVFSDYNYFSYMGIADQFESLFALLGYCLVAYYAFLVVREEKDVKTVLWFLAGGALIMLLIGLSQVSSADFFRTNFAKHLITSEDLLSKGEFEFKFEENRVYLTLYNPNYVGSYTSLLFPTFLMGVFYFEKLWQKIFFGVLSVGTILTLLGSLSRAGFIGVLAALVLIGVMILKNFKKHWIAIAAAFVLIAGIVVGYNIYTGGSFLGRLFSGFNVEKTETHLQKVSTNDDSVDIVYDGNTLSIDLKVSKSGNLTLKTVDGDGKEVDYSPNSDMTGWVTSDERFKDIRIVPASVDNSVFGFIAKIEGRDWTFTNGVEDGTYYFRSPYGKYVKLKETPSAEWMLERGRSFSGRFYIWSKTLPLLKDYFFLGSGADTFQIVYPNTDFVGLYNYGYYGQIMTKPHNLYLQIGVQTGVLSLLCVLAFYIMYFIMSVKLLWKTSSKLRLVGIGTLASSFGYMVVGIINDSTITVAPLFWTLIGLGMAINWLIKKEDGSAQVSQVPAGK